ncbi:50S ribosomal protein L25 [Maridesulfovibrio bastinii]|uniref:50S ribosomal protein L25 n=1 Tax=Maridesulfovibrio bastinii TaxID=47157 RepID=UPI0004227156|nr:50S ribosomal protein L25 [Maridesulfovibrio bastinii]
MSRPTLSASKRTETGKSVNRKLRSAGMVPAVFYSKAGENIALSIKDAEFLKLYRQVRYTQLFDLNIDGETKTTLIWTIQNDPVRGKTFHVDFFGVDMDTPITVKVPVKTVGIAPGVKLGGRMELYRNVLEVTCKPELIPAIIELDISTMTLGQTKFVADVDLGEGVKVNFDNNFALVRCVDKSKAAAAEEEAEEE